MAEGSAGDGPRTTRAEAAPVVLVLMPYGDLARPSLAMGLLKSCLMRAGIGCAVEYASVRFTEKVGIDMPEAPYLARMMGEWVFAGAAFPGAAPVSASEALEHTAHHFSAATPAGFADRRFVESLDRLRAYAPRFVDEVARSVLARRPRIVACGSMFEQHCASLALLRRIRELDPAVITMIGGANCEAEMGWATIRAFPWLDVVVSGEADELLPPLCELLLAHGRELPLAVLPEGVMVRQHVRLNAFGPGGRPVPRATVENLDASPVPDHSDYLAALEASPLRKFVTPGLLIEFSRGCWWGQKHHCTFCGLNGGGMGYRSKRADTAEAELDAMSEATGITGFMATDNIIDLDYLKTLLPALAARNAPYRLFFETKANLKREQVGLLARAGVIWIQPGIEAFHDDLLKLMDKGSTALINVQLLKYCREFGIYATWNLLFGFPAEHDSWHAEVASWLPLIGHLQPPRSIGRVLYDRFSPYHQNPEKYGLQLAPSRSYSAVYALPPELLADLVYFFADTSPGARAVGPGLGALTARVVEWSRRFEDGMPAVLSMSDNGDTIEIYDTRPCALARRHSLSGIDAAVYRAADPATSAGEIRRRLTLPESKDQAVAAALDKLCKLRLVLTVNGRYLALAVPGDSPSIVTDEEFPGGCLIDLDKNRRGENTFSDATLDEFERVTRALFADDLETVDG
jgi:ribosomal peptide maturation radical SAM protein 1